MEKEKEAERGYSTLNLNGETAGEGGKRGEKKLFSSRLGAGPQFLPKKGKVAAAHSFSPLFQWRIGPLFTPPFFPLTQGGSVELWCQSNDYWEWCRWIHFDTYCDYEWSPTTGVAEASCNFPQEKVCSIKIKF